jgi:general secretion pathway protein H
MVSLAAKATMATSSTDAIGTVRRSQRAARRRNTGAMKTVTVRVARACRSSRLGHLGSGFTLVEVLVVVVIIALLASLLAVNLSPDARQTLREEAVRLAALIGHAREEAITTGAPVVWQRIEGGYQFLQRAPGRTWRPVDSDVSLRRRALPEGVILTAIETPSGAKAPEPLIVLSPTGVADPFRITLVFREHRMWVSSDGVGAPVVEDPR